MSARTFDGSPLTPGVNVDRIDLDAGVAMGAALGYDDRLARMIVTYTLQRWARGEEPDAERMWLSYFPNDLTSLRVIVASARSGGGL